MGLISIAATLDEKRCAALLAVERGDFRTARRRAVEAQLLLSTLPASTGAGTSLTWAPAAITEFLGNLDRIESIEAAEDGNDLVAIPVEYIGVRDQVDT